MAEELKIQIVLDDGSVKQGLLNIQKDGSKAATGLTNSFSGFASGASRSMGLLGAAVAAAAAGIYATTRFLSSSAKAAMEAENATNALAASLAQIGKFNQTAVDSFSDYASKLQITTGVSDDLIKQNAALLVSLGGLSGTGLERSTKAALDLSRALQVDTGTAFNLVAKAASGSTSALSRYGIKIDENLPKSERFAAALNLIEKRFGGLAETRLNTFEGSLDNLNNSLAEIPEAIGLIFTQSSSLRAAINFISKSFYELADSITASLKGRDVLKSILLTMVEIGAVINNFVIAPIELFVRSFIFGFKSLKLALDLIVVAFIGFSSILVEAIVIPIEKIVSGIGSLVSVVNNDLGNGLKNAAKNFRTFFTDPMDAELKRSKDIASNTFDSLASDADNVFSFKITDSVNTWLANFKGAIEEAKQTSNDFTNTQQENAQAIGEPYQGILESFQNFSQGFQAEAATFASKSISNFKEVGKQAFQTLGRGVGQAFAAFGQALASGEDAGKAFLQSMLGLFADVAIQLGTSFILQGIAHSMNPLTPGLGGPLIAAGAALATFGGVLKGLSGGKAQTSSSTGGGIAASPSPSTELNQGPELERVKPDTNVQVVVNGDVLDSDESAMRIAQLLGDAFDKKGVVINGAYA